LATAVSLGGERFVERSHIVRIELSKSSRIRQGDVIRGVDCVEYVVEKKGQIEVGLIDYPLVVVLTQDCDLEQDKNLRKKIQTAKDSEVNQGNLLLSVLVAPLYNVEHVYEGGHLSDLGITSPAINGRPKKTPGEKLRNNENARYHYLEFPNSVQIVPSVIDFKHFFTVNLVHLKKIRSQHFVCNISDLFREDISQRFASFLSRVALPQIDNVGKRIKPASSKQAGS
jgi:hypothetical protein